MANYQPYDKRHRDLQEDVRPANSRLFILCSKQATEEMFQKEFERYGGIEDIWVVKDKRSNENKGVTYIKYGKTSEAALAMEEMNGKSLDGDPKPLKVMIASSKREGSIRDPKEDEKNLRLFVIVPKSYSRDDLRKEFEEFGDIDSVSLVTDKYSGANKGFGYVRFHRAYHAALAFEGCDPSFKPKYADPKPQKERDQDVMFDPREVYPGYQSGYRDSGRESRGGSRYDSDRGGRYEDRSYRRDNMRDMRGVGDSMQGMKRGHSEMMDDFGGNMGGGGGFSVSSGPLDILERYPSTGSTRLHITAPIGLSQGYLTRLFSIIPGLEYCDLNEATGQAFARYTSPQCASYARDKLHGFEYPIGSPLVVRCADEQQRPPDLRSLGQSSMGFDSYAGYGGGKAQGNDMFRRAALILENAGINPDRVLGGQQASQDTERVGYCPIPLPPPKKMLPDDTPVAKRLFIVCQPSGTPEKILRDAFCRMGNLIDVYLLPARNYGYAKYATIESAMKAIELLHGQNIGGNRLKVIEAEPTRKDFDNEPYKKQRT
ncbi:Hypothetical predicted protein [Mytilus galloprovincialis]|uniref:RRM domain-containing protein n=1 Tax=Mytilus galloprovincialis TaxID=29158 RepID=A0A8B6EXY4_MYTGA|nr:Hypothetical predicted protein [Mytilus galloprovincialis]